MPETTHLILATAGHVDHGKSALVTALTGTDPDRLPEEKARGLTIELGFAHFDLRDDTADRVVSFGVVDVPGHEDFVHNMVAGVGSVDLALLIVAADDGWMPQTEEHLQILTYSGLQHGVVALSKADLVSESELQKSQASIREKLQDSPLEKAPVIPTSVPAGTGLHELKAALLAAAAEAGPPEDIGKPRLSVDRAFSIAGAGTVVTGTLSGGCFQESQKVRVQPGEMSARIRRLESHGEKVTRAGPGTRTAINLSDVKVDEHTVKGSVVALPDAGIPSSVVDVHLAMSLRLLEMERAHVRPLKDRTRIRFHHGTANIPGTVYLLDTKELLPGEESLAQIRLEAQAFVFSGDRFVLRDWQERLTMAGGIILDARASPKRLHAPQRKAFLQALAGQSTDPASWLKALAQRDGAIQLNQALKQSRFSATKIEESLRNLKIHDGLVEKSGWYIDEGRWAGFIKAAQQSVTDFHATHPEQPGLPITELRTTLEKHPCPTALTEAIINEIYRGGFTQTGTVIHKSDHKASLSTELKTEADSILNLLSQNPKDPPALKNLPSSPAAKKALQYLKHNNTLIQINADLVMVREGYESMVAKIRSHLKKHESATVSDLREALGSNRRIMVPLMEKLDAEGITIRAGDLRSLKE